MTKYKFILLLTAFILSCEQEAEWDIRTGQTFLVADCIITNEFKRHELYLTWSSDSLNQPVKGFSGASVEITDGTTVYSFSEDPAIQGKYVADIPFRATAGLLYRLTLSYSGMADTAFATMKGVSPLEEINIQPSGEYFRYIVNQSSPGHMLEICYNWSDVPDYCNQYGSCQAMEVYYVLNNIDVGKIFAPDRQVIRFPKKTNIIRKKYSLTEDHQRFARSLMLETEWRGGVFDAEAANVPTNFRNGVQGWFAASMVVSDTVYFE